MKLKRENRSNAEKSVEEIESATCKNIIPKIVVYLLTKFLLRSAPEMKWIKIIITAPPQIKQEGITS
jgi:hypothetical protein